MRTVIGLLPSMRVFGTLQRDVPMSRVVFQPHGSKCYVWSLNQWKKLYGRLPRADPKEIVLLELPPNV